MKKRLSWLVMGIVFSLYVKIQAQPNFTAHILHDFGGIATVGGIKAADLDLDNRMDIVAAGPNPNVVWFPNLGNGSFGPLNEIYDAEIFCETVAMMDIHEDGDPDIIAAMSFSNLVVWIENLGNGQFAEAITIYEDEYPIDDLILLDVDHNDFPDIVYSTYSSIDKAGAVKWIKNDGNGQFSNPSVITTQANEVKKISAGDLNNDSWQDIVVASYWDFRLDWYANNGNGTFSLPHHVRNPLDSVRNQASVTADLDGDGDIDILNIAQIAPFLTWFENNGQGTFLQQHVVSNELVSWDAVIADFDLDGDPDIISGTSNADELVFFANDGIGNFSPPHALANNLEIPNDLEVADVDGDYDLDILVASTLEGKYLWYENHRLDCIPLVDSVTGYVCDQGVFAFGNYSFAGEGLYQVAIPIVQGCDSVYLIQVIHEDSDTILVYDTIQTGETYVLPDFSEVMTSGVYASMFSNIAGCDSVIYTHLHVDEMVSTQSISQDQLIQCFPNPSHNELYISANQLNSGQCRLFSMEGKVIQLQPQAENGKHLKFDVSSLQAGVYYIQFVDVTGRNSLVRWVKL